MGRLSRSVIFAFMILLLGVYLAFSDKEQKISKVKTTEEYWFETALGTQPLEELLQDDSCRSSERYFLACVNALQAAAQKFGYTLTPQGKWVSTGKAQLQPLSEKESLTSWKAFLAARAEIPQFPFVELWRTWSQAHLKPTQMSYAVGLGMNGFLSVFRDPHTYILPASLYSEVVAKVNPKSLSVGVVIGRNDSHYFIKKVIENSSSYLAGLKKGDLLWTVNGTKVELLSLQELGEAFKGEAGSTLELQVLRHSKIKKITIVRTEQTLPTVSAQVLEGPRPLGVLTVNKFAIDACQEVKEALKRLKGQGVEGVLLDLRDNPGGQMEEATCVASLFVGPGKKIYDIKALSFDVDDESSYSEEAQEYAGPMAVLINAGSASAAEIVAGVLKDYRRAVLVGERTFGKGSFQEGEIWAKNDKIALFETKGFYYLPSGKSPQMTGIEPDVRVRFKDRFTIREEDQFWSPLLAPPLKTTTELRADLALELSRDFSRDHRACLSVPGELVNLEDPEMKEAHRILNCRGVARQGTL